MTDERAPLVKTYYMWQAAYLLSRRARFLRAAPRAGRSVFFFFEGDEACRALLPAFWADEGIRRLVRARGIVAEVIAVVHERGLCEREDVAHLLAELDA